MKLSDKMKLAGWVILKERNGSFTVYGSNSQEYRYDARQDCWSEDLKTIEISLEQDLRHNSASDMGFGQSPFVISSRLTALNHTRQISQPVKYLCSEGVVSEKSVLHLGTGLDRFAGEALLKAGCSGVTDYDPNFFPDRSVLNRKYDIVMAHYVLNILPPADRKQVYALIRQTLNDSGRAYLTVQGIWPVEHRYEILGPLEDGYEIRTGFNKTFRKGYSPEGFLDEIRNELGGTSRILTTFYSNTLAEWHRR